jgi:hypothetical protein
MMSPCTETLNRKNVLFPPPVLYLAPRIRPSHHLIAMFMLDSKVFRKGAPLGRYSSVNQGSEERHSPRSCHWSGPSDPLPRAALSSSRLSAQRAPSPHTSLLSSRAILVVHDRNRPRASTVRAFHMHGVHLADFPFSISSSFSSAQRMVQREWEVPTDTGVRWVTGGQLAR